MKFDVVYANGVQHEVELQGHTVTIGRDPACDLVLNDAKCSRRHAVIEMGPSGLAVRDNGSANGVFVNGKKIERSPLAPGDIVRLGETALKILEESRGTVVMDADDDPVEYQETEDLTRPQDLALPDLPTPTAPQAPIASTPKFAPPPLPPLTPAIPKPPRKPASLPPRARPMTGIPKPRGGALERPLTVTVLAVLWLLAGACYGALGLGLAIFGPSGPKGIAAGATGVFMAALGGGLGFGLWSRASWARLLQLAAAGIGVFSCVFTLPSLAIIAYLLRPEIRFHFAGPQHLSPEDAEKARTATPESAFTAGIVASMLLGVLISLVLGYFGLQYVRQAPIPAGKGDSMSVPTPAPTP